MANQGPTPFGTGNSSSQGGSQPQARPNNIIGEPQPSVLPGYHVASSPQHFNSAPEPQPLLPEGGISDELLGINKQSAPRMQSNSYTHTGHGGGGSSNVSAAATPNGVVTTTENNQTGQTFTQSGSGPMVYQGYAAMPPAPVAGSSNVGLGSTPNGVVTTTERQLGPLPASSEQVSQSLTRPSQVPGVFDYAAFGNSATASSSGGRYPTYVVTGTLPNGQNYSVTTTVPYIQNPEYKDQAVSQAYGTFVQNPSLNADITPGSSAALGLNLNTGAASIIGSPAVPFSTGGSSGSPPLQPGYYLVNGQAVAVNSPDLYFSQTAPGTSLNYLGPLSGAGAPSQQYLSFLNSGQNAGIYFGASPAAQSLAGAQQSATQAPAPLTPAQGAEMAQLAGELGSSGTILSTAQNQAFLQSLAQAGLSPAEASDFVSGLSASQLRQLASGSPYTLYIRPDLASASGLSLSVPALMNAGQQWPNASPAMLSPSPQYSMPMPYPLVNGTGQYAPQSSGQNAGVPISFGRPGIGLPQTLSGSPRNLNSLLAQDKTTSQLPGLPAYQSPGVQQRGLSNSNANPLSSTINWIGQTLNNLGFSIIQWFPDTAQRLQQFNAQNQNYVNQNAAAFRSGQISQAQFLENTVGIQANNVFGSIGLLMNALPIIGPLGKAIDDLTPGLKGLILSPNPEQKLAGIGIMTGEAAILTRLLLAAPGAVPEAAAGAGLTEDELASIAASPFNQADIPWGTFAARIGGGAAVMGGLNAGLGAAFAGQTSPKQVSSNLLSGANQGAAYGGILGGADELVPALGMVNDISNPYLRFLGSGAQNAAINLGLINAGSLLTQGNAAPLPSDMLGAALPFAMEGGLGIMGNVGPRIESYSPNEGNYANGLVFKLGESQYPLVSLVRENLPMAPNPGEEAMLSSSGMTPADVQAPPSPKTSIQFGAPAFESDTSLQSPEGAQRNNQNAITSDYALRVVKNTLKQGIDSGSITDPATAQSYLNVINLVQDSMAQARGAQKPITLELHLDPEKYTPDAQTEIKKIVGELGKQYGLYGSASIGVNLQPLAERFGSSVFRGAHDLDLVQLQITASDPASLAQTLAKRMSDATGQAYTVDPNSPNLVISPDGSHVFDIKPPGRLSLSLQGAPAGGEEQILPQKMLGKTNADFITVDGNKVAPLQNNILGKAFSTLNPQVSEGGSFTYGPAAYRAQDFGDLFTLMYRTAQLTGNDPAPIDAQAQQAIGLGLLDPAAYAKALGDPTNIQLAKYEIAKTPPSDIYAPTLSASPAVSSAPSPAAPPQPGQLGAPASPQALGASPSGLQSGFYDPISAATQQSLYNAMASPASSSPRVNGVPYSAAVLGSLASSASQEQYNNYVNSMVYRSLIESGASPSLAQSLYNRYLSSLPSASGASPSPSPMASYPSPYFLSPMSAYASAFSSLSPGYSSPYQSPYSPYYNYSSSLPYSPIYKKEIGKRPAPPLFISAQYQPSALAGSGFALVPGKATEFQNSVAAELLPALQQQAVGPGNNPLLGLAVRYSPEQVGAPASPQPLSAATGIVVRAPARMKPLAPALPSEQEALA